VEPPGLLIADALTFHALRDYSTLEWMGKKVRLSAPVPKGEGPGALAARRVVRDHSRLAPGANVYRPLRGLLVVWCVLSPGSRLGLPSFARYAGSSSELHWLRRGLLG
jgi:hypothetical protein